MMKGELLKTRDLAQLSEEVQQCFALSAQFLGKSVRVTQGTHGHCRHTTNKNMVCVHIESSAHKNPRVKGFSHISGVRLDDWEHAGYEYVGIGDPIVDSEGEIIAEKVGNVLYLLFKPTYRLIGTLRNVFLQYDGWEIRSKESRTERMMRNEKEYLDLCTSLHMNINTARTQYQSALQLNGVKEIRIVGDRVHIYTKPIHVSVEKNIYDLGRFIIVWHVQRENIRILSRTDGRVRPYSYSTHPNVSSDGTACFGNMSFDLTMALQDRDVGAVALIVIHYLSSSLSDYESEALSGWPKVKRQNKRKGRPNESQAKKRV